MTDRQLRIIAWIEGHPGTSTAAVANHFDFTCLSAASDALERTAWNLILAPEMGIRLIKTIPENQKKRAAWKILQKRSARADHESKS